MIKDRHKQVLKEMVENGGKLPDAMRKQKYKENYINNPQKIKRTDSWKELVEEYLPDKLIAEKHKALLNKKIDGQIDTNAVKSGVDMAYKVKGHYAPEKHKVEQEIEITDHDIHPEDKELLKKYKQELRENIIKRAKSEK